ncbi:choice-of-anchor M domain-containing protein, partial [Streptomyces sp. NPDC046977]|uniref:choice-of-anchor M domain-containing protein n=1 Tax=Streptomyces sp. NPDC046977 TaxID=3154703 RepID=UPI00340248F9
MASVRKSHRTTAGALGSVVLAAALSPAAFAGTPAEGIQALPSSAPQVVVSLDSDELSLELADGSGMAPASASEPAPVDLELGPDTQTVIPAGTEYAFLGPSGDPIWVLDGTGSPQGTTTPTPHWDTTGVPVENLADGTVEWAFTSIEGPGDAVLFAPPESSTPDAPTAPRVLFDSADGFPDAQSLPAADSGEVAWAFTRPGTYQLTSQATARLTNGKTATAAQQWTVHVAADESVQPSAPATATPTPGVNEPGSA